MTDCKFGENCLRSDCKFTHPNGKKLELLKEIEEAKKINDEILKNIIKEKLELLDLLDKVEKMDQQRKLDQKKVDIKEEKIEEETKIEYSEESVIKENIILCSSILKSTKLQCQNPVKENGKCGKHNKKKKVKVEKKVKQPIIPSNSILKSQYQNPIKGKKQICQAIVKTTNTPCENKISKKSTTGKFCGIHLKEDINEFICQAIVKTTNVRCENKVNEKSITKRFCGIHLKCEM